MQDHKLENLLEELPIGAFRFFESAGSTNDEAAEWVKAGCPNFALIVADEQTSGRGRSGRKWFTPAGSALAFSLVLKATEPLQQLLAQQNTARLNGLGAMAVCQALQEKYSLSAQIKWPNDIIANGKKLSGVLAESRWQGSQLIAVILGIGINITSASIPPSDWDALNPHPFPATSVETVLGASVERWELLYAVLEALLAWYDRLTEDVFIQSWEANLAYRGQKVQVYQTGNMNTTQLGNILGLADDGGLKIETDSGEERCLRSGIILAPDSSFREFHLRPVDSPPK